MHHYSYCCARDRRMSEKEKLKKEIVRMWNKRIAQVIPVVVGSLGSASVTKNLDKWLES